MANLERKVSETTCKIIGGYGFNKNVIIKIGFSFFIKDAEKLINCNVSHKYTILYRRMFKDFAVVKVAWKLLNCFVWFFLWNIPYNIDVCLKIWTNFDYWIWWYYKDSPFKKFLRNFDINSNVGWVWTLMHESGSILTFVSNIRYCIVACSKIST